MSIEVCSAKERQNMIGIFHSVQVKFFETLRKITSAQYILVVESEILYGLIVIVVRLALTLGDEAVDSEQRHSIPDQGTQGCKEIFPAFLMLSFPGLPPVPNGRAGNLAA